MATITNAAVFFTATLTMSAAIFGLCSAGQRAVAQNNTADQLEDLSPLALFEQRIMPIFKSPEPSSCVQCHLASVDLKDYILPSHEQTFVSLRDQGLIDLEQPRASKILQLIEMGEQDRDAYAKRIHARLRKAEYEAFAAWIVACCADPKMRSLPPVADPPPAGPVKPDAVIEFTKTQSGSSLLVEENLHVGVPDEVHSDG